MNFNKALEHFKKNSDGVIAASGEGVVLNSLSEKFPGLKRAAFTLMAVAAIGLGSTAANALTIDEQIAKNATSESGVDYFVFNDETQSTFSFTREGVDQAFWDEAPDYVLTLADQANVRGMKTGDIAINQSQGYFKGMATYFLPTLLHAPEGYTDPLVTAGQESVTAFHNAYNAYKSVHTEMMVQDIGTDNFDIDKLLANVPHIEDEFVLTTIALHHKVDPEKVKELFGKFVIEHELGHSAITNKVDRAVTDMEGEYGAEIYGMLNVLHYAAEKYPQDYEGLSASILSATKLFRLATDPDGHHVGAVEGNVVVDAMHKMGKLDLDAAQNLTREAVTSRLREYLEDSLISSAMENAKQTADVKSDVYAERAYSFNWLGEASEKAVQYISDPQSKAYQDVKAKYLKTAPTKTLDDRLSKLRDKRASEDLGRPYKFGS